MTLSRIDTLIHAEWIIPVIPRGLVLRGHSMALDKGKIVAIAPQAELSRRYEARDEISLPEHALIPGLINAHGHAAMTLMRGYADDKPLMEWLEKHIWPIEQAWVNADFVRDGSRLAIAEMLLSGTTCFSDMYFFPEETAAVALQAGIRAQLSFPILDFPSPWGSGADEYLRKGISLHDQYRGNELLRFVFGPHAPYTVSDEPLRKIATYAEELQMPVHIHLHETAGEVADSLARYGVRPIERLNNLGLLSPLAQCVHMTQITDSDIALLQQSGAHVVHCPESNLKLASGLCPVARLLEAGINVCLGTDGAASNNDLDLSDEMRTAALIGKLAANDASAINAVTALEMATINGARALGLETQIGSLEVGKKADIVALDLSGIQHHPMYDPISHIVYTKAGHKVAHLWVNGRHLIDDFNLSSMNIDEIKATSRQWQDKLAKSNRSA